MALGPVYGISVNGSGSYEKVSSLPVQTNSLIYNGTLQSPVWSYDTSQLKIVEDSGQQKAADSYVVKFKPLSKYCWADGTQKAKEFFWTISPATISDPVLTESTKTFNGDFQSPDIKYDSKISSYGDDPSDIFTIEGGSQKNANSSYVISWTIKSSNYVWATETSAVKTAVWKINKKEITDPVVTETSKTYNTASQGPTVNPASDDWWTATDSTAINVNNYTMVISLNDPDNTVWKTAKNSEDKTFDWSIVPLQISKPSGAPLSFTYKGIAQGPIITNAPSSLYAVRTGNLTEINSGSYSITYSLSKNQGSIINTKWSDGTTGDITVNYVINPLQIPIPSAAATSQEYNGSVQNPGLSDVTDYLNFLITSGDSTGEDAGKYTVSYAIDTAHNATVRNVTWSDDSVTQKSIDWYITVKKITKPSLTSYDFSFSPSGIQISNYEKNFNDTFMQRTSDSDITGLDVGSYSTKYHITKNKTDITNVTWADGTTADVVLAWKINILALTIPSQSGTLIYNTKSQSPSWNSAYDTSLMTIAGNTGTDAKTYAAVFTSKYPGNAQFNGSNSASANWKINILSLTIPVLAETSYVYSGDIKTPVINNFNSTYMSSIGNLNATLANTGYKITVKLTKNTDSVINVKWSDDSITDKVLTWGINKAPAPQITASSYNVTLTPSKNTATVTLTTTSDGAFSVINPDTNKISCSVTDTVLTIRTVTETDTSTPIKLTVKTLEGNNYLASTSSTQAQISVSLTGFAISLSVASTDITQSNTLYYEGGKSLTAEFTNFDSSYMNISGHTGKNVGSYTATIVCKSGYQFKDGKSSVSISWVINEASVNIVDTAGNATIDTTYCNESNIITEPTRFGTEAFYCDGNENHQLIINDVKSLISLTSNWTVEMWIRIASNDNRQPYTKSGVTYYMPIFNFCNLFSLTMTDYMTYSTKNVTNSGSLTGNFSMNIFGSNMCAVKESNYDSYYLSSTSWSHCACVYNSSTKKLTFYIDGKGISTVTYSSLGHAGSNFTFNYEGVNAFIDEVRISNNMRYSANFSVSSKAFTKDNYTKMLLHFDQ